MNHNYGGYLEQDVSNDYGGQLSIDTPCCGQYQAANEFVNHRLLEEATDSANTGIVQIGLTRSGPDAHMDNCASVSAWTVFVEWRDVNEPTNEGFQCKFHPDISPGAGGVYCDVGLYSAGSDVWDDTAECGNGVLNSHVQVNWGTGFSGVGGEIVGGSADCSYTKTNYGGNGEYWMYYTDRVGDFAYGNQDEPRLTPSTDWANVGKPGYDHGFDIEHSSGSGC